MVLGRASRISPSISIFSSFAKVSAASDPADVHRLWSLVADFLVELHLRVLRQGLETLPADPGVVHEEVLVTVVRSDKAEALVVVEPLDRSRRHLRLPFLKLHAGREATGPRTGKRY